MGAKRTNGEGSWSEVTLNDHTYQMYRIVINGKRKSFYGKTKKEALVKYKKHIDTPEIQNKSQSITFSDYCSNWLRNYKKDKVKPKTYDYYEAMIDGYITGTTLGSTTIRKLNGMQFKDIPPCLITTCYLFVISLKVP